MEKKIIAFANLLRKSGIRVSVAESIDSFMSIDALSFDDREVFRDALRATMVKRSEDIPGFDQLFDLYWSSFYDGLRNAFDQAAGQMGGAAICTLAMLIRFLTASCGVFPSAGKSISKQ